MSNFTHKQSTTHNVESATTGAITVSTYSLFSDGDDLGRTWTLYESNGFYESYVEGTDTVTGDSVQIDMPEFITEMLIKALPVTKESI